MIKVTINLIFCLRNDKLAGLVEKVKKLRLEEPAQEEEESGGWGEEKGGRRRSGCSGLMRSGCSWLMRREWLKTEGSRHLRSAHGTAVAGAEQHWEESVHLVASLP